MKPSEFKNLSPSQRKQILVNGITQWMGTISRGDSEKLPLKFEGHDGSVIVTNSARGWIATVKLPNSSEVRNVDKSEKKTAEFIFKSVNV